MKWVELYRPNLHPTKTKSAQYPSNKTEVLLNKATQIKDVDTYLEIAKDQNERPNIVPGLLWSYKQWMSSLTLTRFM